MGSALVIVGLAVVLAVQIAIHLRIAALSTRVAALTLTAAGVARPESDAFQEVLARRLNLIVRGIQGYHDQIAEDFRVQVAAGEQRARLAEGKAADAAPIVAELRALAREMGSIAAELPALQGDFAELVVAAAELRAAPAPAAKAPEDPDERKTVEIPQPPMTGAPPPMTGAPPPASSTAPPPAEGADDEGWEDPEEKTKVFSKDAAPAVLVALRQRAGAPTVRVSRHALRPPPPKDDDDAMERPSILPEAR